jgi:Sigma-70 region 3
MDGLELARCGTARILSFMNDDLAAVEVVGTEAKVEMLCALLGNAGIISMHRLTNRGAGTFEGLLVGGPRELLSMARPPVSLETPVGEEQDGRLADFVADESAESAFDRAAVSLRRINLRRLLELLPPRERRVIELCVSASTARGRARSRRSAKR